MKSRPLTATSRNQTSMQFRLHFFTNFHFQLNWYSSSIKWPLSPYWRVCHCWGLVAQQLLFFFLHFKRKYKLFRVSQWFFTSPADSTNLATVYWYPLSFTGSTAVAKHFTTVYNLSDHHGESFTFKTFGTFVVVVFLTKTWRRSSRNYCVQA